MSISQCFTCLLKQWSGNALSQKYTQRQLTLLSGKWFTYLLFYHRFYLGANQQARTTQNFPVWRMYKMNVDIILGSILLMFRSQSGKPQLELHRLHTRPLKDVWYPISFFSLHHINWRIPYCTLVALISDELHKWHSKWTKDASGSHHKLTTSRRVFCLFFLRRGCDTIEHGSWSWLRSLYSYQTGICGWSMCDRRCIQQAHTWVNHRNTIETLVNSQKKSPCADS